MDETKIPLVTANSAVNLAIDTIRKDKQGLVFCSTKRGAEKTAEDIAKSIKEKRNDWSQLAAKALNALSKPTKQCKRLSKCMESGIAFHHAGLTMKQRDIIETAFREKKILMIASTPTLAAGLDLPAFRTIIKDLKRYGHRGLSYIPVLEYLQMAGRAGRPKYDKYGEAICIASTESEKNQIEERYIYGEPEEIYSKLAVEPVLRTYLLSLIATRFVQTKEEIISFFERTFWAHQFKDMVKLEMIMDKMLDLLEHWEFIRSNEENKDFKTAYSMPKIKYKATIVGKRVAELYLDPLTAHHLIKGLRKATSKSSAQTFPYLQLFSNTIEMMPQLKVTRKDVEEIQEKVNIFDDDLLDKEPSIYDPEYDDFLNSVKTASCFYEWISETDEDTLLDRFNIKPGELKAKLDILDWLVYASVELARLQQFAGPMQDLQRIRLRLKHGIKEELIPLVKLKGIGRVRARKLFRNRIKDVGDVKKADSQKLADLIGKATALKLKQQVGIDESRIVIKENKRKGQISLQDF